MKIRALLFVVVLALASTSVFAQSKRIPTLATNAFPVPMSQLIADSIREASQLYGVDPNLVAAMAFRESRFNPNAVSRLGAIGVMQLKPRTAQGLGVKDIYDARENILGGTKYLASLLKRFNGDVELALAGYNAGPEKVAKEGPRATREAVDYVAAVRSMYSIALRAL
ncbi:MAG TPA: lytic transglycosylase domain-containing protein [Thermoanaerobaculia bacterium]